MTRYLLAFTLIFIVANVHVLAEDAKDKCGANAEIDLCGGMCEPTCGCRKHNPMFCPRIQCGGITSGCRCKEGFVRNDSKECVSPEDCPKKDDSGPKLTGLKFCLDED
ncbi:chymotrypsin inhibitor-like isoform X2 [Cotesia glomerata]|uniref:TIL domain-containing protein n=1 Tax=Cotesia glomerata TaxID=32391 RepID=A0AAV7ILE4_COTGL|nr:chymotrypsin inhibitor-like isoform X2 [Cotesia glomerata]KAH0552057.1 hypothetical protein KQX54_004800 [Cotesia glomerata]